MRISDWSSDVCSSDLHMFWREAGERLALVTAGHAGGGAVPQIFGVDISIAGLDGPALCQVALDQIGRASCRERVCQYVSISAVAESLNKTNNYYPHHTLHKTN